MTGLRVWARGVRAAPAALLAHIVVRPEPVACPNILAALEAALTLTGTIAIAFAYTTRPIIPTVVHVPVLPATWRWLHTHRSPPGTRSWLPHPGCIAARSDTGRSHRNRLRLHCTAHNPDSSLRARSFRPTCGGFAHIVVRPEPVAVPPHPDCTGARSDTRRSHHNRLRPHCTAHSPDSSPRARSSPPPAAASHTS